MRFLGEFLRQPKIIGAVAPSSRSLAGAMLDRLPFAHARTVVECGPGTGAITGQLLERLQPGTRYFAIEINDWCVTEFRRRYPGARIHHGSVADVDALCRLEDVPSVDIVISSLPWAAFKEADQERYLDALLAALSPAGHFVTFAYVQGLLLSAGRHFRRSLEARFTDVEMSPVVWKNLPPAVVYRCRV
jgi:phosphatidylethanolamine/phosphatidyl-N-methylethanolamine N-methyltransferase